MTLCYRGRTWCSSSKSCANTTCDRHFGEAARRAAREWWGNDDAPVAFADHRETCGEFRPVGEQLQQQATEAQQS